MPNLLPSHSDPYDFAARIHFSVIIRQHAQDTHIKIKAASGRIRRHSVRYPAGVAELTSRDVLEDYDKKMRDAENESHEGKRKVESVWYVACCRHRTETHIAGRSCA